MRIGVVYGILLGLAGGVVDKFSGTSVLTAAAATSSATGTETFSGTSALSAGAAATTGVGTETFSGTSALTGGAATETGAGTETFSGTSALTGAAATSSATGTETFSGTSALSAGAATTTGVGATPPDTFAGTAATLWLRWDLGTTVGSGTISAANDQSPAGNNVSQATGSKQPAYTANNSSYSLRPTATFVRANSQALNTSAAMNTVQPITIYVVGHGTETTSGAFIDSVTVNSTLAVALFHSTNARGYAGSFLNGATSVQSPSVMCFVANGASSAVYTNNSQTADVSGNAGVHAEAAGVAVGGSGSTTNYLGGVIAEVVFFPSAHNATTRANWFAYFANMYGIAAS